MGIETTRASRLSAARRTRREKYSTPGPALTRSTPSRAGTLERRPPSKSIRRPGDDPPQLASIEQHHARAVAERLREHLLQPEGERHRRGVTRLEEHVAARDVGRDARQAVLAETRRELGHPDEVLAPDVD